MKPVAVGILTRDERVLICQRKREGTYPLKWEFPGGKVNHGESPEAAVVRELREELGIDAVIEREFHRQDWIYPFAEADRVKENTYRVFYYLIRSYRGEPVNHAFEHIMWVAPKDLEAMDILEGNREAVQILIANVTER